MNVNFQPQNFITNLSYMAKGMIGIMAVILIIVAVTLILNKVTKDKNE